MNNTHQKEENIRVIVRIKAKTSEDITPDYSKITTKNTNTISIISENEKIKEFYYDYIAEENSTQNEIFEQCGKNICDHVLEGYNGTIFAYGQTGSGKTYTLLGKNITDQTKNKNNNIEIEMNEINNNYNNSDERIGLIPRILYYLFNKSNTNYSSENENKFLFKISFMEIYNDQIKDLLNPKNEEKVEIREDDKKVIHLINLRKLIISTPEEAINIIKKGNHFRKTASTSMNKQSSRSHAIISIYIENNLEKEKKVKKSVFHIIDLAGSERQKKAKISGDRLKECGNINQSLYFLTRVIQSIIEKKKIYLIEIANLLIY